MIYLSPKTIPAVAAIGTRVCAQLYTLIILLFEDSCSNLLKMDAAVAWQVIQCVHSCNSTCSGTLYCYVTTLVSQFRKFLHKRQHPNRVPGTHLKNESHVYTQGCVHMY